MERPEQRNRTGDTLKKIGRIAIPVIIGGLIAHNNRGHGAQTPPQQQQEDHQADRRIEVTPKQLVVGGRLSVVTVTNVGRDPVAINSIEVTGNAAGNFTRRSDCRSLAPGQSCHISLGLAKENGGEAVLVIDSNAGRASVALMAPQLPG